jgi:hypothetical protein
VIRAAAGVGIPSILAVGPVPGWGLMSLVGLMPLVTGLTGYCLGYVPLGVETRHGFSRKATEEVSDGLD